MARSYLPVSSLESPRFAGIPTFMRLPYVDPKSDEIADVHIALVGVPWDGGTTNRAGARHGPRQLRDLSSMVRRVHPITNLDPFAAFHCADVGDVPINPADVMDTLQRITTFYDRLVAHGITPLTAGGDHLVSLPVLRSVAKSGPLAMVHFDSHTDLLDTFFGGFKYTHGTPFRRAIEEGLLDPKKIIQIGIRGSMYDGEDIAFARASGIRIVRIEELMERGVADVMREVRDIVGETATYISFDIDGIDPSQAPGTGTPEIGGFTTFDAQRMIRHLTGLDIVAADLVEVSPPFDPSGGTAWVGASLMFELLCAIVPGRAHRMKRGSSR